MDDPQQAEYLEEIAELKARLAALEEAGSDLARIEEFAIEVRLLEAILLAARELRDQLRERPQLGEQLILQGFSPTSFRDVYAFVYDRAMEIDRAGAELAREVERTDFSALLSG